MKPRKIFVNLAVKDIERSRAFFTKLGFSFNPQFSSDDTLCMVLSEEGYVMLLQEKKFATFTNQPLVDATKATEGLYCLSCESRAEVESLVKTAIENGGRPAMPAQDHGFMFGWSFYDPDGHHWEVMWMDPAAVAQG